MARKMKKFSAGGAQGRYDRRMADIKKDFAKDSAGKSGKALEVLEAKRMQRTADAKDDLAKRTGADRTSTRAAEAAAESNLTKTRKFGAPKAVTTEAPASKVMDSMPALTAPKMDSSIGKPQSFAAAFKDARSRLGAGKTFTFNGKSFTTNIAGEGRKPTSGGSSTNKGAGTAGSSTKKGAEAEKTIAPSQFNKKAFTDLKAKVANRSVPAVGGAALRGQAPKPKAEAPKPKPKAEAPKSKTDRPSAAILSANLNQKPGDKYVRRSPYADVNLNQKPGDRKKVESRNETFANVKLAKGGKAKTMKYAKGGSTPPQPTPADRARSKKHLDELKKLKPTDKEGKVVASANRSEGPGYKKGGKAMPFAATKFGKALVKKSADTKGRAMVKKAGGGKCYAKGGSIDGIAKKGKTKGKMV